MMISDHQVRRFIALIIIERRLITQTAQHVLDYWNDDAIKGTHQPYVIDLLDFVSVANIPAATKYIRFRDNPNHYDFNHFNVMWLEMTTYDNTINEGKPYGSKD